MKKGEFLLPLSMKYLSVSPLDHRLLFEANILPNHILFQQVEQAHKAFRFWQKKTIAERLEPVQKIATLIRTHKRNLAELSSIEMGKPLAEAIAEIEKCAVLCDHYVENAAQYLKDTIFDDTHRLTYQPLGVILGIMPWNFPYWQVFRASIPILCAGNTIMVKHAPNVPQCALAIAELFQEAGFETGVYTNLFINHEQSNKVIEHKYIQGVTLTGSTRAGKLVAEQAGKNLKKCVLELGGSDPCVILPDADLDALMPIAIRSRFGNCGQSCIAAKRFLVHEDIAPIFIERLSQAIVNFNVGNPLDTNHNMGPLARWDLLETAHQQVQEATQKGARIVMGGHRIGDEGNFYAPTLLTHVNPTMRVMREEVFAPIAVVYTFNRLEQALEVANATEYGLGASVWTQNTALAQEIAQELVAGSVFINALVRSDPNYPFGGTKTSGLGRELSYFGIQEFTNLKLIVSNTP